MAKEIEKITVSIQFDNNKVNVGELILQNRKIYFKYFSNFVERGLQLSPIKMPLSTNILSAQPEPFDGLFGVFHDSLPDGWGMLLLDRKLASIGIDIRNTSPLERLAYIGGNGKGALCYKPAYEITEEQNPSFNLDIIATELNQVLEGESTEILEELYQLGGSSGGARPKVLVGYNLATNHIIHNSSQLPEGYEHWIIKFNSSSDPVDAAHIEYAYSQMALSAGIEMNTCKLFTGKSGMKYFGTKRFDRDGNKRIHMHSASGIMHDNYRMSTMDYGHLMDCAFQLEKHVEAYRKVFRLAAFNVFSHNRDDHSKNFSFLMDNQGIWKFAPAYDLTFSNSAFGHHSTSVNGENQNPGTKQLLELAHYFGIKKPQNIIDEVREAVLHWNDFANENEVSRLSRNKIKGTMDKIC